MFANVVYFTTLWEVKIAILNEYLWPAIGLVFAAVAISDGRAISSLARL